MSKDFLETLGITFIVVIILGVIILAIGGVTWLLHECPVVCEHGEMFVSDTIHFEGLEPISVVEPEYKLFDSSLEVSVELEWRTCDKCGGEYVHIISNGVPVIVE